jgi:hypothetical protein
MKIKIISIILWSVLLFGCETDSTNNSMLSAIESNTIWPYKLTGEFDVIDAAVGNNDSDTPDWIIGTITNPSNNEDVLVEFKSKAAQNSGFTMEFNYKNPVTLWVNESVNEYYQVERVE